MTFCMVPNGHNPSPWASKVELVEKKKKTKKNQTNKKKNLPANAGDIKDVGLIPGSDPLKEGMAAYSSILDCRIS